MADRRGGRRTGGGGSPRRPPKRPRRSSRPSRAAWLKLGLGLVALLVLGLWSWHWLQRPVERPDLGSGSSPGDRGEEGGRAPSVEPGGEPTSLEPVEHQVAEPAEVPAMEGDAPVDPVGHLSIVIDDLGRSLGDIDRLEALGIPLSYAVLPFESKTAEVVARLRKDGQEILCHLPMEAMAGNNPGPGALVLGMTPRQLARATRKAISQIPGVVGVNNHMGSGLTRDADSMRAILEVLRDEELFFLDSRTSADTVAFGIARSLEIPTAERQVFLDTDPSVEAIRAQFERLRRLGAERGAAIAIGHPYPSTLEVLEVEVPASRAQGFNFVPVSFLLERTGLR